MCGIKVSDQGDREEKRRNICLCKQILPFKVTMDTQARERERRR